ncbi:MAG: hypothetical protein ACK4MF_01160 [Hyphomicrobiaceae bacterium]
MKFSLAAVACALALGLAAPSSASAAPLNAAHGIAGSAIQSAANEVRHRPGHYGNHRNWRHRGDRHRHWRHRRCWNDCVGVGPLRVCKRKCR